MYRVLFLPEFELDSDEVDDIHDDLMLTTPRGHTDQSMPLLIGLFDSSATRRSLDVPNGHEMTAVGEYDLEDLAAKRTAGGGLADSIANMANSILGAGKNSVLKMLKHITNLTTGIIGDFRPCNLAFVFAHSPTSRVTLCHQPGGFLYGLDTPGDSMWCDRLDHSSYRRQRKTERSTFIYRNYGSLFWFQWQSRCFFLSILFRIRR